MNKTTILVALVLVGVVLAVNFRFENNTITALGNFTIQLNLDNNITIYGYELSLSEQLDIVTFLSAQSTTNNTLITTNRWNSTSTRIAVITNTGILPGNRTVLNITYNATQEGRVNMTANVTTYDKNGTIMPSSIQNTTLTINQIVNHFELRNITARPHSTAATRLCITNEQNITGYEFDLVYNASVLNITAVWGNATLNSTHIKSTEYLQPGQNCTLNMSFDITDAEIGKQYQLNIVNLTAQNNGINLQTTHTDASIDIQGIRLACTNQTVLAGENATITVNITKTSPSTAGLYYILTYNGTYFTPDATRNGTLSFAYDTNTIRIAKIYNTSDETNITINTNTSTPSGNYSIDFINATASTQNSTLLQSSNNQNCVLTVTTCQDQDADGYGTGPGCAETDCNDDDKNVHPGATEQCNSKDDNCDGSIDEGACTSSSSGSGGSGGGGSSGGKSGSAQGIGSTSQSQGLHAPTFTPTMEAPPAKQKQIPKPITTQKVNLAPESTAPKKRDIMPIILGSLILLLGIFYLVTQYMQKSKKPEEPGSMGSPSPPPRTYTPPSY